MAQPNTNNPNLAVCPDYATPIYQASRNIFKAAQAGSSDNDAIAHLKSLWVATNDAEKAEWLQREAAAVATAAQALQQAQQAADQAAAQAKIDEDAARREEMKKHRAKYMNVLTRLVPSSLPILPNSTVLEKVQAGKYFLLWFFTNEGIKSAHRFTARDREIVTRLGA